MKKNNLILIFILLIIVIQTSAQTTIKDKKQKTVFKDYIAKDLNKQYVDDYLFSMSFGTYTDITDAVSLNNNELWDDPEYLIPLGFDFEFLGTSSDTLYLGVGLGAILSTKYDSNYNAEYLIFAFETDLIDRGDISGVSQSPISYKIEGNAGNRIAIIEWKNAGFYDEGDSLGTLNDYINFQLWLYEFSGNIEMHFGPNMITNPNINYFGETGAYIGLSDSALTNAYFLSDSANAPIMVNSALAINGTPANGVIYQFQKNNIGIKKNDVSLNSIKVYPNPFGNTLTIETSNVLDNASLEVYNTQGILVKQFLNISGKHFILKRDNLSSGVYFLKLWDNKELIMKKMIMVIE